MSTFRKFAQRFGRDSAAMRDGKWFAVADLDTLRVKVRSEDAPDVRDYIASQVRTQRKVLVKFKGVLPAKLNDANEIDLCVDKLLVDWEHMEDEKGGAVAYSKEMARHYLTKYPEFREEVLSIARDKSNYGEAADDAEDLEEVVGNSETSSLGDSDTKKDQH